MVKHLVEGRVLDELGNPVAGAFVTLQSEDTPVPDIASITGSEGRFRLKLPTGNFFVFVTTRTGLHGMAKLSEFNDGRFSPIIHLHS